MTDDQIDAIERALVQQGKPAMTFIERYAFARAIEQFVLEEAARRLESEAKDSNYKAGETYCFAAAIVRAQNCQ